MIDSHCHLADETFSGDLDDVVRRAKDAGLERVMVVLEGGNLKEATPGDARSEGPHRTAVQIGQSRQSRTAQRRAEGDLGADESSPLATRWLAITR